MKKVTVVCIVFVIVAAVLVYVVRSPSASTPPIKHGDDPAAAPQSRSITHEGPYVSFVGITNIGVKGKCASFTMTNESDAELICSPEAIEQKLDGQWVNKPFTGKAVWRATREWVGFREQLPGRQAFTFSVPFTSNTEPWRVVVRCQEKAAIRDTTADALAKVTGDGSLPKGAHQITGKRYAVTSPEVSE